MKFSEIKQLTQQANYQVNIWWEDLDESLDHYRRSNCGGGLDTDPDFQRGHVWTEAQQIAYVEFKLMGGSGSNDLYTNCVGWMNDFQGPFVLVDGKQRLNAALRFIRNEIPAFGHYRKEFVGRIPSHAEFIFHVNNLKTREEVLTWYLEMNSGGTPHTQEELDRVRAMLEEK